MLYGSVIVSAYPFAFAVRDSINMTTYTAMFIHQLLIHDVKSVANKKFRDKLVLL